MPAKPSALSAPTPQPTSAPEPASEPAAPPLHIGAVCMEAPPIDGAMLCEDVVALFNELTHLPALAVVQNQTPVGIVHRTELLAELAHTYGVALWGRKPISLLMSKNPLIMECNTTIDAAGIQFMEEWKDGWNVSYILTEEGRYAGIGSLFDLIKLKSQQSQARAVVLDQARLDAEAANRSKSNFLAHMSHELRTPLNAIIGFSEILKDEVFGPLGSDAYEEYVDDIHQSANLLLALINDILDLSKADVGKMKIRREPVDLRRAIDQSITLLRNQATRDNIDIKCKLAANLPLVCGDSLRIRQILLNLLSNAIKFTEKGGTVAVHAYPEPGGDQLVLIVTDTGIGIPKEEQQKIFEPFIQVESLLTRTQGGSGLGLPLTKRLVELHEGTLELESVPDTGTTVTVLLPVYRPKISLPEKA